MQGGDSGAYFSILSRKKHYVPRWLLVGIEDIHLHLHIPECDLHYPGPTIDA
jgi:hypothetical protein